VPADDPRSLAEAIARLRGAGAQAGARAIERVRALTEPDVVARKLEEIYAAAGR
jgi:hypothetical protein